MVELMLRLRVEKLNFTQETVKTESGRGCVARRALAVMGGSSRARFERARCSRDEEGRFGLWWTRGPGIGVSRFCGGRRRRSWGLTVVDALLVFLHVGDGVSAAQILRLRFVVRQQSN